MNYREKQALVKRANERRGAISDLKGPEYAGQAGAYTDEDQDVLANFKRQDLRWGFLGGGLQSAFLYFGKHIDSIETFAREYTRLVNDPNTGYDDHAFSALLTSGEGIISRLDDARNYLDLIECLLWDEALHPEVDKRPDDTDYWPGAALPWCECDFCSSRPYELYCDQDCDYCTDPGDCARLCEKERAPTQA